MVGTDTSTADCWAELSFHDKDHFSTAHPLAWMMPAGNYGFTAQYFHQRLPSYFWCTKMLQTRCNLKHVIHSFAAGFCKIKHQVLLSVPVFEKILEFKAYTLLNRAGSFCRQCGPVSAGHCTAAYCPHYNCVCDWKEPAETGSPVAWSCAEVSCDLITHKKKIGKDIFMTLRRHAPHLLFVLWMVFTVISQMLCRKWALGQDLGPARAQCLLPLCPTSPQTGSRALCFYTSAGSPQGNVNHY